MVIAPILIAACQFSGFIALCVYASKIFEKTGSTVNPNFSTIIMGCNQLMGTILASSLVDRVGRRLLLLVSSAGASFFLTVTAAYCYLHASDYDVSSWSLMPVFSLSAFVIVISIGMMPIPLVIASEVLPQKVIIN